jgi:hypothetical protein
MMTDNLMRLSSILDDLIATPRYPIEPVTIETEVYSGSTIANVISPFGVVAANVSVMRLPRWCRPGRQASFELDLNETYPSRSPNEIRVALVSLARNIDVVAHCEGTTDRLPYSSKIKMSAQCVDVSVCVPESAAIGADVLIEVISVAGVPLPLLQPLMWPIRLRVARGMAAPLILSAGIKPTAHQSPAVSSDGMLYAPTSEEGLLLYAADGTLQPCEIRREISRRCNSVALCEAPSGDTLFLGIPQGINSQLCAVATDPAGQWHVRWRTEEGAFSGYVFVAVLPTRCVVFATSCNTQRLCAYDISDGKRIADVSTDYNPIYIATDPMSDTIFVSHHLGILTFKWDYDHRKFSALGEMMWRKIQTLSPHYSALAVVVNDSRSWLVVANEGASELHVLSLPEQQLFFTHTMPGRAIVGLAANPSGDTLVVASSAVHGRSGMSVHALAWPLSGMPFSKFVARVP